MEDIRSIQLLRDSKEELLPGFFADFPYIASRALLDRYDTMATPWHWHGAVELFYMESGTLEYHTPNFSGIFPAGWGGLVNANVLHSSRVIPSGQETVQLLHLFLPEFLSGGRNNRMDVKYIRPMAAAGGPELLVLSPEDPGQAAVLERIRSAFDLNPDQWGYEFSLRQALSEIWLELLQLAGPPTKLCPDGWAADEKLKCMIRYIHAHYSEPICVDRLAGEAHISRRACFRLFRQKLHTTPAAYLTDYRLDTARRRLEDTDEPITHIAYSCGLGSSSYFGKLFRERFGTTPAAYRKSWHDPDRK